MVDAYNSPFLHCFSCAMVMDLYSASFLFSFLSLFLLLLLLKRKRYGGGGASSRLPPGPWKLPIIGSLHHLLGPLPHHSLAALAKRHGPVMHLQLGEVSTLVVSSPAAAAEILKTHDISFANRPFMLASKIAGYGDLGIIMPSYGTYWRELRKISILELLSAKRVRSFRSIREEEALGLVRSIASLAEADSTVNLSKKLLRLTNDISARVIIGSRCKYQEEFLRIVGIQLEAAGGFSLADLFPSSSLVGLLSGMVPKLRRLHEEVDMILGSIVEEHKQSKDSQGEKEVQDLVDVMIKIQDDGSLPFHFTDDSVKAVILDLFGAASETSATTMEWVMSELMRNPTEMEKVQREVREILDGKAKVSEEDTSKMNYLRLVIKEALRLHPPAPLLVPHECRETTEVFGYQIPARTKVLVNAWAIARDPKLWEDAEEFKPERFIESTVDFKGNDFAFIPFGAGRRMCPGMAFGLANVEFPLACLLYYFDWKLPTAAGEELDMAEFFMLTARRRSDLCLSAIRRTPR